MPYILGVLLALLHYRVQLGVFEHVELFLITSSNDGLIQYMLIHCSQRSTSWYYMGWAGYKVEVGLVGCAPQWSRMMETLLSPVCYWAAILASVCLCAQAEKNA